MPWEILLSAALEVGLGLLAKAGFGRETRSLEERLAGSEEEKRQAAFEKAFDAATQAAGEEEIQPLLEHAPFQEAVITGLLDPEQGFDLATVADSWVGNLPVQAVALRRFFRTLENTLLSDDTWGPLLERFQTLRFRKDVLEILRERNLDVPISQITSSIYIKHMKGSSKAVGVEIGQVQSGGQVNIHHTTIVDSKDETESVRRRYLQKIAIETNRLPWAPMDSGQADATGQETPGLTSVYTALDTTELERVEQEEQLRKLMADLERGEAQRIPAQEMANREGKLLILGDPGSGKSTFVKHLAYHLARAGMEEDPASQLEHLSPWDHGLLLPVLVELRDWAVRLSPDSEGSAKLLLDYLQRTLVEWKLEDFWPALCGAIQGGEEELRLLVLLDGLDEVPTELRGLVVDTVQDFADRYGRHRYAVTCRPYAYVGQPWKLAGFHEVTLAPFSQEQIDRFIRGWYEQQHQRGFLNQRDAGERTGRLQQAVHRTDLQTLAGNPLLLTVMALLHTFRGRLPDDRTELFDEVVDLLLRRWEERLSGKVGLLEYLDVPGLRMSDVKEGVYRIAFECHSTASTEGGVAFISEGNLRGWLAPYVGNSWDKAGDFSGYIQQRAGLLAQPRTGLYVFPHWSIQEFLAACYLVGRPDYPTEAANRVRADYDRWREVFVLAAGHAARTQRLGQAIASVNALCPQGVEGTIPQAEDFRYAVLAGKSLLETGLAGVKRESSGQAVLQRVQEWLMAAMRADKVLPARERADAGAELDQLGDPRFRADTFYLPDEDLWGFVEVPAGKFLMGSSDADRIGYINEKPQHEMELPVFYMAHYPVTVAQFGVFIGSSGYKPVIERSLQGLPNHPVVTVSWYDAMAYCQWLTRVLQDREDTPEPLKTLLQKEGWVITLPSEAEWEKAVRGTDGRIYPWGDEPDPERANYDDTGIGTTSAVGCFPGGASPYSIEDMSGNVLEWTRSLYKSYPYKSDDGREYLSAEGSRVLRGGSFLNGNRIIRCAYRGKLPDGLDWLRGFRVVAAPGPNLP